MQIGEFLKKFQKIIHDEEFSKKALCEILFKNTGKEFYTKDIKISRNILYIQSDLFVKNAIFFKKKKILEQINTISDKKVVDIR